MPTGTIRINSPALSGATTYSILLPDPAQAGPGPYPVLLQLHGAHDDHTAWLEKSRLQQYVERLPLIVVMPSGRNFWWSNLHPMLRYEDLLMDDLRAHVEATYPTRTGAPWAIGGLSMGGFGAIHLGLKHPDRFCSVYAHSSALLSGDEIQNWFGNLPDPVLADLDCAAWVRQRTPAGIPRLSFDCGTEDHLITHNRRFHALLNSLGLPHGYAEFPGGHTWTYWDTHVQTALQQHAEVLGISWQPEPPPA